MGTRRATRTSPSCSTHGARRRGSSDVGKVSTCCCSRRPRSSWRPNWRRSAPRYAWSAVRDADWHRHRFLARPGGGYRHLIVRQAGEPRAAAVLRAEGARLLWVDLVWDGRSVEDLALLESEVRRRGRAAGAEEVELWLGGDVEAATALAALGWPEEAHPDLVLVVRSLVADAGHEEIAERLYFTLADSDLA